MMLSKEHQAIVQATFARVEAHSDRFVTLFYRHLFEENPALRKLFGTNLKAQGDALYRMFILAVEGLNHPSDLIPSLNDLGLHHAGYGVKPEDYETFGRALSKTLAEILATDFTPDVAIAWQTFYKFLSSNAIDGMVEDQL